MPSNRDPGSPEAEPEPERRFRSPFAISPRTLIIVGLLAIVVGAFGLRDHVGFLISAEQADAEVVSVETLDAQEGFTLYRPTVRYLSRHDGLVTVAADTYRPTSAGGIKEPKTFLTEMTPSKHEKLALNTYGKLLDES